MTRSAATPRRESLLKALRIGAANGSLKDPQLSGVALLRELPHQRLHPLSVQDKNGISLVAKEQRCAVVFRNNFDGTPRGYPEFLAELGHS
jgi:hypothetical protein